MKILQDRREMTEKIRESKVITPQHTTTEAAATTMHICMLFIAAIYQFSKDDYSSRRHKWRRKGMGYKTFHRTKSTILAKFNHSRSTYLLSDTYYTNVDQRYKDTDDSFSMTTSM